METLKETIEKLAAAKEKELQENKISYLSFIYKYDKLANEYINNIEYMNKAKKEIDKLIAIITNNEKEAIKKLYSAFLDFESIKSIDNIYYHDNSMTIHTLNVIGVIDSKERTILNDYNYYTKQYQQYKYYIELLENILKENENTYTLYYNTLKNS